MTWRRRRVWARRALSILIVATAAAIAYADGQVEILGEEPHDFTIANDIGIVGTGELTEAFILNPSPPGAFRLMANMVGDLCSANGLSCQYTTRPLSNNPQLIGLRCIYSGMGSATARLRVVGSNPAVDFDEENISCFANSNNEAFTVSPLTVNVGDVVVGTPSNTGPVITVTNLLSTEVPLSITGLLPEWTITGCPIPCVLQPLETKQLGVTLTPPVIGPLDSIAMFTGGAGANMSGYVVMLRGNGIATESLDVTIPAGPVFNLDMGPVPLSGGTRTLRLRYTGTNPMAGASITSTDPERVSVPSVAVNTPSGNTDITVTCKSPVPDEVFETLTIQSSPQVTQNTMMVNVLCSVTSASVSLEPSELGFGDVLKDTNSVELTVMVRNTGAATVLLDDFEIVSAAPLSTLALTTMPVGDLTPGGVALVKLLMTPSVAEDYADTTKLTFTVDGIALDVPVKGRVTERSGRIDPTGALDLGTACEGAPVAGTIRLTNDGTAPFEMMAPMITGPFAGTYSPDVTFPAQIPVGQVQSVSITTTQTSGSLAGTFTWLGDVGPYVLDLRAEYIADGTAVSPRSHDFAVIDVDATSAPRLITLENCDSAPTTLSVESVLSRQGPARAWLIEPAMETVTLAPGERYTVMVRFAPFTPGQHLAELPFIIGGAQTTVTLSGFADGELFERTSFYACTCSGGGSLAGAWPLLLAVLPLRRRRRRALPRLAEQP